ncbi:MAG: entericidin A/B family lipoprotein [Betaproteobacteria bacterium]
MKPTIESRKEVAIMLKRILLLIGVLASISLSTLALTACNTIEGAGKDISNAGSAIQHEARENK